MTVLRKRTAGKPLPGPPDWLRGLTTARQRPPRCRMLRWSQPHGRHAGAFSQVRNRHSAC